MSSVWKRLQKAVGTKQKPGTADVVNEAVESESKSKAKGRPKSKSAKSPPVRSPPRKRNDKNHRQTEEYYDTEEMRDVLKLFNKLEELVVEGDPRVRQVLERKPLVQQALLEEGDVTDRSGPSPRATIPRLQFGSPREPTFLREESGISARPTMYREKQSTFSDVGPRYQQQPRYLNERYQSNNAIVLNQTIPEEGVLSNTYQINNYQGGKVRKHPDGTLLTTTNGPTIHEGRINDTNPSFTRPILQPTRSNPPERFARNPVPALSQRETVVPKLDLHEFNYETPRGKSKVQVKLRGDDKTHNFNYVNPDAGYQVRVSLDNLPAPNDDPFDQRPKEAAPEVLPQPQQTRPITQNVGLPPPVKRDPIFAKRSNNPSWMDITSKVITADGGEISCSGCKITVPKNAIPNKALIRVSVMDVQEVPFTSKSSVRSDRIPNLLPISAAISMEPQNLVLQKPITIRLMTSIAKVNEQGGTIPETSQTKKDTEQLRGTEGDIKAKDIIIKYRNVYTSDAWQNLETDIFRSSDSVTFRTQELANVCAFHVRSDKDVLIKKIAVYMFQSLERRKKQFLSILVCEDQPHILQKGIESMPGWLHYMDSCFNISMEEGKNLAIFLEPKDRTLCSIDVNKMEIPWENLWRPECIIRKHFMVTLHKLDFEAPIQLMVNEANYSMTTSFIWQIQRKAIFLPDPVPLEDYTFEPDKTNDDLLLEPPTKEYSSLYKHVSWKPETPEQNGVTNESLLRYAKM